jgi:hypothetical protein
MASIDPFTDDFEIISRHLKHHINLILGGDEDKMEAFPLQPLLEKALDNSSFKLYMFDASRRLVMFIPDMSLDILATRLLDYEDRFSLAESEMLESIHEFISTRRMQLAKLEDNYSDIEDVFSIYVLSGKHLLRAFDVFSHGAVVFALQFGSMNQLNFDQYNFDYALPELFEPVFEY